MPHRDDAKLLEIFQRQLGKNLQVDGILAKRSLVLAETEPAEPIADLHGRFPVRQSHDGQSNITCPRDHLPLRQ